MVCWYCGGATKVTNSRHQKRQNTVWRRRQCLGCSSLVTTEETISYESVLMVQTSNGRLVAFSRDKLLISLYKSLAHRPTASSDAAALCNTILGAVRTAQDASALISQQLIANHAASCLTRFDDLAGHHYRAYHPVTKTG